MWTSVEGIYEQDKARLLEPGAGIDRARLVVTALPEPADGFRDPLDLPITPEGRAVWERILRSVPDLCLDRATGGFANT